MIHKSFKYTLYMQKLGFINYSFDDKLQQITSSNGVSYDQ